MLDNIEFLLGIKFLRDKEAVTLPSEVLGIDTPSPRPQSLREWSTLDVVKCETVSGTILFGFYFNAPTIGGNDMNVYTS
jgi:hypothetical protein